MPLPPRFAEFLLRRSLETRFRDTALGDFREEFLARFEAEGPGAAKRWYRRQVYRSVWPNLRRRVSDRFESSRAPESGITVLDNLIRDGRHAVRALTHNPGFSATVVTVLAIGVGATTAQFALLDGVVLAPLPYDRPGELASITHHSAALGRRDVGLSTGLYFFYRDRAHDFESLGVFQEDVLNFERPGLSAERINIALADPALFRVFRVVPEVGRLYTDEDARPGFLNLSWAIPILISHDFWSSHFASSPAVVGQVITINGNPRQVVGVLPPAFAFPKASTEVWQLWEPRRGAARFVGMGHLAVGGVARLKPGITAEAAQTELQHLLPQVIGVYADATQQAYDHLKLTPVVVPLKDALTGSVPRVLWTLFGGMLGLLLIACTNVAALFAVRLNDRRRETAVRVAVGAEQHDIMRLFFMEALLLTASAAALGLVLARGLIWWAISAAPIALPRQSEIHLNWQSVVLAYALCTLLAVAYAALSVRRQARSALTTDLVGGARSTAATSGGSFDWFLSLQVGLALTLMIGSGLMVRTYANLSRTSLGFQPANVLAIDIGLPYREAEAHARIYQQLAERLSSLPGVSSATAASFAPLTSPDYLFPVQPGGEPVSFKFFVPGYFATMKTGVVEGTGFDPGTHSTQHDSVLISAALARDLFPTEDAIGKSLQRLSLSDALTTSSVLGTYTVVGIVADVKESSLRLGASEVVYIPEREPNVETTIMPTEMTFLLRTDVSPLSVAAAARRTIAAFDPDISVSSIRTLDDVVLSAKGKEAFVGVLLLGAAIVSLLLGVVGVYGSVAQMVRRRTPEIGVRIALGADPVEILLTVGSTAMISVAAGSVGGLLVAFITGSSLKALLFGVQADDPFVFGSVFAGLLIASAAAAALAGFRAVRLSPVVAMRTE